MSGSQISAGPEVRWNNWEPFNTGLPRIIVTGLALRRETNRLYASTMGRGAYNRTLN